MGKIIKPQIRHHQFTLGLGFFGLHRRPMIDYFPYLFSEKSSFKKDLLLTLYDGQHRTSFGGLRYGA